MSSVYLSYYYSLCFKPDKEPIRAQQYRSTTLSAGTQYHGSGLQPSLRIDFGFDVAQ